VSGSRKLVLLVDDEPAVLKLLEESLPAHLPNFELATASNGREAIAFLEEHAADVLVTDVNMPVMDGFELLAHASRKLPNLPIVVLSVMAPEAVHHGLAELGSISVLRKPASPAVVAKAIKEARAATARGRLSHVPLATLLQLMHLERKTCSLFVRSGTSKGRLHFLSGELVNAYSFELDVDGEAAARYLLALDTVTVDFERSLHNHDRRIHLPLEQLLLEVAAARDEMARSSGATEPTVVGPAEDDARGEPGRGAAGAAGFDPEPAVADEAEREAGERPTPSDPAERGAIERAAAGLEHALAHLRTRAVGTWSLLEEVSPLLATVASGADSPVPATERDGRSASEWREVADLAQALARTADLLAEPAPSD
jgi:CheY-like chemotaxis protein